MIDWRQFYAASKLADPDIAFEWGTKYLYLVPKEVTRDKWEVYAEVARAYDVPVKEEAVPYRFFLTTNYFVGRTFSHMPWTEPTVPTVKAGPNARPNLSRDFRRLQENVDKLREFDALRALERTRALKKASAPSAVHSQRIWVLVNDPFIQQWREP